jgi:glycerol-3-phosphate dehydrogenase (NAD(P)+)
MEKIVIVGSGKWGTAMGSLLNKNKHKFDYWKKGDNLPSDSIIIMCIPTLAIREVLMEYGPDLKNVIYINGAKGIEQNSHKLPYQIVTEILDGNIDYFSLIGPGFAEEVKDKMPTLVNIGYTKDKNKELVRSLFQTDYFRVRMTKGIRALELASAFKNVYAIACGLADGLGYRTNTRTKLILLAIEEFYGLSKKLGYKIDRRALPGTIGDLILTCNSEESRNFSFGKNLAKNRVKDALKKIRETVEGYTTVESVPYFEQISKVERPLARFVYEVIRTDNPKGAKNRFQDFVKTA